jgi:hypothetical protein
MRVRINKAAAQAAKVYPVVHKGDRVSLRWEPGMFGTIVEPGVEVSGCIMDDQPDKFPRYYANEHYLTGEKHAGGNRTRHGAEREPRLARKGQVEQPALASRTRTRIRIAQR